MSRPSFIQETFLIRGTFAQFKGWIESWRLAHYPDSYWMVYYLIEVDKSHTLHWTVPNEMGKTAEIGRITFNIVPIDAELLEAKAVYADDADIKAYMAPLLESIRLRWLYQGDEPEFERLITNPELSQLLKTRWQESKRTFQAGAYLSTIVLLGSILEGMLQHKIHTDPKRAGNSKSAPKDRKGTVRPFDEWSLETMITVAHECDWLDTDVRSYAVALREYRNLIHPRKQLNNGVYPDEDTCLMSWPVIKAALSDLRR